jgi:hypothetical protein
MIKSTESNLPIGYTSGDYILHWLVTGIVNRPIDFNWIPTRAGRRDLAEGVSGIFTALNPDTCFLELGVSRESPPPGTYMVTFNANLRLGDYRSVPSSQWSGVYYSQDHNFSHEFYSAHSGEMYQSGCHGHIRYSPKALALRRYEEVVVLRETAMSELVVTNIEPVGLSSPTPSVIYFGECDPQPWSPPTV